MPFFYVTSKNLPIVVQDVSVCLLLFEMFWVMVASNITDSQIGPEYGQ